MISLSSKVIVVTGSTRGIGRAIAEACARAGASVVISSRNADSVAYTINELRASSLAASGITADAASPEDLRRLFEFSLQNHGRIDVWVNNAGISGGYRTLQSMTPGEIKDVIDTNLLGTFNSCRLLIPYLREHGGIILNMSGRGGRGNGVPYQAAYAATKAAVMSLTRSLAAENKGYRISINCVMPGMVATDMFKSVATCPETEKQMDIMPVLLKSFASPIPDVQKLFVELCGQEPGRYTGRCYSAEKPGRYLRALAAAPDNAAFVRHTRKAIGSGPDRLQLPHSYAVLP